MSKTRNPTDSQSSKAPRQSSRSSLKRQRPSSTSFSSFLKHSRPAVWLTSLFRFLLQTFIDGLVYIVTAVLSHPSVQEAGCTMIVRAMNSFMTQPNLDQRLIQMNDIISKSQHQIALKSGQEFPQVVGQFLKGMLTPGRTTAATVPGGGDTHTTEGMRLVPILDADEDALSTPEKATASPKKMNKHDQNNTRPSHVRESSSTDRDDDDDDDDDNAVPQPPRRSESSPTLSSLFQRASSSRNVMSTHEKHPIGLVRSLSHDDAADDTTLIPHLTESYDTVTDEDTTKVDSTNRGNNHKKEDGLGGVMSSFFQPFGGMRQRAASK